MGAQDQVDLDEPLPSCIQAAVGAWGERGLMERCVRLYRDMEWGDEPQLLSYLAGRKGPRWVTLGLGVQGYLVRTWALRAMLYAWDPAAASTVVDALGDEHWRPREMALKVIAKRRIDDDVDLVDALRDDSNARVQAAAARALRRLSG